MTTARDIMNPGATCVGEDQTLLEAARMMRDMGVGSLPICGNDQKLHGIITDRDIVVKCIADGKDASTCTAGELAQGEITWVDATTDVTEVVDLMGREQVKRLPVIEDHQLVGMISEADLARHLDEHQLSEFVEKVFARP
jgi:CBS domain-containing protein